MNQMLRLWMQKVEWYMDIVGESLLERYINQGLIEPGRKDSDTFYGACCALVVIICVLHPQEVELIIASISSHDVLDSRSLAEAATFQAEKWLEESKHQIESNTTLLAQLQTSLLLAISYKFSGNSFAFRQLIVQYIGKIQSFILKKKIDQNQIKTMNKIFWRFYSIDRFICLHEGVACTITTQHVQAWQDILKGETFRLNPFSAELTRLATLAGTYGENLLNLRIGSVAEMYVNFESRAAQCDDELAKFEDQLSFKHKSLKSHQISLLIFLSARVRRDFSLRLSQLIRSAKTFTDQKAQFCSAMRRKSLNTAKTLIKTAFNCLIGPSMEEVSLNFFVCFVFESVNELIRAVGDGLKTDAEGTSLISELDDDVRYASKGRNILVLISRISSQNYSKILKETICERFNTFLQSYCDGKIITYSSVSMVTEKQIQETIELISKSQKSAPTFHTNTFTEKIDIFGTSIGKDGMYLV